MPIINISTWPTPTEIKKNIMEKITKLIHEETGAPLDKITVFFNEIVKDSWSEGGILGSDPEFREKSRRKTFDEK
jgi:4-oxalocrotonate tautomerase